MIYAQPGTEGSVVTFQQRYGNYIGGEWVAPVKGEYFTNITPCTGEAICEIPRSTAEDIELALDAAHKAKDAWGRTSVAERSNILLKIADRLEANLERLAVAETWDNGKAVRETMAADVPLSIDHFRYFAGCIRAQEGTIGEIDENTVAYHFHEPLGVVGQIIPWNFPLLMAAWKLAPALAAGNTCVLKPAESTPLTAWALAEILQEVELPPGVVNIVNGAGATGAAIVGHEDVDKVAFTGSTPVGRIIMRQIAGSKKRATMELGGKGAHVVFADAPLDQAVEGVINGIFFNQGHVCCAGSRLIVEESIADAFVERLKLRIASLRIGDPMDKNTDIGAINSKEQLGTVNSYIEIARQEGATLWQGCANEPPEKGYWVKPTLLTGVSQTNRVVREEIFGPVLAVVTFRTPEEAVKKANDSEFGLSAGVWSGNEARLFEIAHALNAGVVWANGYNLFDPASPFGGIRHSGFGREGGIHGLYPYLRLEA